MTKMMSQSTNVWIKIIETLISGVEIIPQQTKAESNITKATGEI